MRAIVALLVLVIPLRAQAADPMASVRADRWAEAQDAAATYLDPVVPKLVAYYRLMAPGVGSYDEIVRFQHDNPDWPMQATLTRRRDEALAAMADDALAGAACDATRPALPMALLRCADAFAQGGRPADAAAFANAAWIAGDATMEPRLLPHWGAALTREAQYRRFDWLSFVDAAAAARQVPRLDPADRPRAEARLALKRDAPNAQALLAALPTDQQAEPALVLERLRWLRRANHDEEAVATWLGAGAPAERAIGAEHRAAFWDERNLMARRRLRQGDVAGAYALAAGHAQTGSEQVADAEFLAGFVALRKLNNPGLAMGHFQVLARQSKAAITQGRAHYWLARAGGGAAEYTMAAVWPNTYYGQLAVLALGQDLTAAIQARAEAPADPPEALALAGREVARAAAYLTLWGEGRRAQVFLLRLDEIAPSPADRTLAARLALGFGSPETAIALARRAGRDGIVQLDTGWPAPFAIPADVALDPALADGIIRQESSFDAATTSPVGARGLMQLMPATAAAVARQLGMAAPLPALTADPALNIRLGSVYLKGLLDQFGGVIPYAVAGYNAGPGRVAEWTGQYGDPRAGGDVDMIDWIELIPFSETRNYVQRVIENQVIYAAQSLAAKSHAGTPHPLAAFLRQGS